MIMRISPAYNSSSLLYYFIRGVSTLSLSLLCFLGWCKNQSEQLDYSVSQAILMKWLSGEGQVNVYCCEILHASTITIKLISDRHLVSLVWRETDWQNKTEIDWQIVAILTHFPYVEDSVLSTGEEMEKITYESFVKEKKYIMVPCFHNNKNIGIVSIVTTLILSKGLLHKPYFPSLRRVFILSIFVFLVFFLG